MSRTYSLSYLTASDIPPPDLASTAAELGYAAMGLRVMPAAKGGPYWPLLEDAALLKATIARLKATGTKVLDVEIVWLTPEFDVSAIRRLVDMCAALGARAILVGGADRDVSRMTASFADLCAVAKPSGLAIDLEYMPWTSVPDAATATRIVSNAKQPNGGVLVDALHFMRAGTTISEVAAMPREWLHYAQICDGPIVPPHTTEGMIYAARFERLLPGDGGIPLRALFDAMPADIPISVEIPHAKIINEIGAREWARCALAATKRVLEPPVTQGRGSA